MKPQAPCKDCENRQPSCHSYCEDYISFRKEIAKYNEETAKKNRVERDLDHIWRRRPH